MEGQVGAVLKSGLATISRFEKVLDARGIECLNHANPGCDCSRTKHCIQQSSADVIASRVQCRKSRLEVVSRARFTKMGRRPKRSKTLASDARLSANRLGRKELIAQL